MKKLRTFFLQSVIGAVVFNDLFNLKNNIDTAQLSSIEKKTITD